MNRYSPSLKPKPRKCGRAAAAQRTPTALTFLSSFSPDAFDHAMDAADFNDEDPGATSKAEPICRLCGASIGIFLERGLDWLRYAGDGTTVGGQYIYDPG